MTAYLDRKNITVVVETEKSLKNEVSKKISPLGVALPPSFHPV